MSYRIDVKIMKVVRRKPKDFITVADQVCRSLEGVTIQQIEVRMRYLIEAKAIKINGEFNLYSPLRNI